MRPQPTLLVRQTADGHRIVLGLGGVAWERQPRRIGWITLAALLVLTAVAYAYVRRLLRPLQDIGDGAARFGSGARLTVAVGGSVEHAIQQSLPLGRGGAAHARLLRGSKASRTPSPMNTSRIRSPPRTTKPVMPSQGA